MIKLLFIYLFSSTVFSLTPVEKNLNLLAQSLIERTHQHPKHIIFNDLRLPSSQKRMWIFDVASQKVCLQDYVTHGKDSGYLVATSFSNTEGSHQSSSGVYIIEGHYSGHHGYALILNGLERGINHLAKKRHIVIHGANYVSDSFLKKYGRIGRSWGCPAVSHQSLALIKNRIEPGDLLINITNDPSWIGSTTLIDTSLLT
ncbi:murein L,D-transpeptidase catalytic domain family protein [Gammaproteobacteria bacterium]|nr:murein L,D-transpeptidase catalytic domain family protein [Gammaproteobacteria bacterium]